MNKYVTGAMIKKLREARGLTQLQLANKLCVSDKAVSKWETGRGYPDVTLVEPLAAALGISVIELLSGEDVANTNRSFNMNRLRFYVCPVCGNVMVAAGETVVSCCGITLPSLEAEMPDEAHDLQVKVVEDEYFFTCEHPMTKEHFVSFVVAVRADGYELVKLYPEGPAQARVKIRGLRRVLWYCNHHGLFELSITQLRKRL